MDAELLQKVGANHADVSYRDGKGTNHWVMWIIKNDIVFILSLTRVARQKQIASTGTSAIKLYNILSLIINTIEVALS